jgi:hypothetical protein
VSLAADVIDACAKPVTKAEIRQYTGQPDGILDPMLESLVRGHYIIADVGGRYRLTTREEREKWAAA